MKQFFSFVKKAFYFLKTCLSNSIGAIGQIKNRVLDYLERKDWRERENANTIYSLAQLEKYLAGHEVAEYCLENLYKGDIADAHRNGYLHIHDLNMGIAAYCCGFDTYLILSKGFPPAISNTACSAPPKHFSSALGQLVNFIGTVSNEIAGAVALNDFDVLLAPYLELDELSDREIYQRLQEFIYSINTPSRWNQTPFVNLTIDFTVPDYLKNLPVIAGKPLDITYGEYKRLQALMNRINRNLLKLLIKGDSQGRPFTFPVITINITKDFKQRVPEDIQELLWEWTAYKGGGYYQNMISSDLDVSDIRSMCCRLRLDLTELKRNVGTSIGGSSPQTGSLGVVDINLPLIAQNYKFRFFQALIGYVNLACVALIKKRQIVDKLWKYGLFPYLRHYLKDFSHHFLTVSVQGAWEAWIFLGKPDNFTDFCLKIANIVRQEILKWQQKTGYLFNWEEAPGEGCCYRFAKFLKNYDKQFITNGLKLPVDYSDDLYDYIKHYDKILPLFTGGSMFLIFVGEKLQPYSVWPLIRMLTYKTKIPYFAITPTFSYCPKCKCTYQGKMEKCIECGTACEIYDRVVGYYRPTKLWNKGKQEEFQNRKRFNLNNKSP